MKGGIAVITTVKGRYKHWKLHRESLQRGRELADLHILVTMGASGYATKPGNPPLLVVPMTNGAGELPLSAARNLGARAAIEAGAELLVFLDVDCIAGRDLIWGYREAARDQVACCGPVTYLPPEREHSYDLDRVALLDAPHEARPAPAPDETIRWDAWELFWSLSFAIRSKDWQLIGGFDERYTGYGAEDTDFGQKLKAAKFQLHWIGSARAYHQYHPVEDPPVQHLKSIVANANLYADKWGWFPMEEWLAKFVDLGLIHQSSDGHYALGGCPRADFAEPESSA